MNERDRFFSQFRFRPELRGCVGVEREFFLASSLDPLVVVPEAKEFLLAVCDDAWGYELSACQVEYRTRPHKSLCGLEDDLFRGGMQGARSASHVSLFLSGRDVGPEDMPLDVFPIPRYKRIATSISLEQLQAACRVTGTHLHIGVRHLEEAIAVHNRFSSKLPEFLRDGEYSSALRLRLYETMARNWVPPHYGSAQHFYEVALSQGFAHDPRSCYHLVRISVHGTVEVRLFGATEDCGKIISWAERFLKIGQLT